MRKKRIIRILLLLAVLLLTGLYATRNQWTAYALRRLVHSQSEGQIILNFDKVGVDVLGRTLIIYHPKINFKKVYFNKAQGIKLQKAEFQKLRLINISLWDFLAHHQFICDNLSIEDPSFILNQNHQNIKKNSSSFNPAVLINVLQNHEIAHINFRFLIYHSKIDFGKITSIQTKGKNVYGSARYNMSIEKMGTIKTAGDTLAPFGFEKLELSVWALNRHFTAENTVLKLDSAFYSSQNNTLFLNGLRVSTAKNSNPKIPEINLFLRWARISGLKTINQPKTGKKILQLGNIKVVGGSYTFKEKQKKEEKKSVSKLIQNLFASYNILSLKNLSLNHIHLFETNGQRDTILRIKRINLQMKDLWTTKKITSDPLKSLHYQNLSVSFQSVNLGKERSRLFVRSGNGRYTSTDNKLFINSLTIRNRCRRDTTMRFSFKTDKLVMDSLSDKKFQKGEMQFLSVRLDSPKLFWADDSTCPQKQASLPDYLRTFRIGKVDIRNGGAEYRANGNLKLSVFGMSLFANGLQASVLSGTQRAIRYDTLRYHSEGSRLSVANKGFLLKTGEMLWQQHRFKVSGLRLFKSDTSRQDTLRVQSVSLTNPSLNKLIFGHKLIAGSMCLYKADFAQSLHPKTTPADTLPAKHWNSYIKLPFQTHIGFVCVKNSLFHLTSLSPEKHFEIRSRLNLSLYGFKMGYSHSHLISQPGHCDARLYKTEITRGNLTARLEKTNLNSDSGSLHIQNMDLHTAGDSTLQYKISLPDIRLHALNYPALMRSDSLIFRKATIEKGMANLQLTNFNNEKLSKFVSRWAFVYDSIVLNRFQLRLKIHKENKLEVISIRHLNLFYHPGLLHQNLTSDTTLNLVNNWDFSADKITYSDSTKNFHMVADRIALQSAGNRLTIQRITGTNFSALMLRPEIKNVYSYFLLNNISLNGMYLNSHPQKHLILKSWEIPGIWISIIDRDTIKKKRTLAFLNSKFFTQYSDILRSIHVDSSSFKNVNFSYRYDHMNKLINVKDADIMTSNIQLGKSMSGKSPGVLFEDMLIGLNNRAIVSGDSMYTFRTKDIRVNLADRKISLDSITLTPRYGRDDFFAKAGFQTDRITLYGKSAVLDGFCPEELMNSHTLHFGKLSLNNLSLRFERDMHYPRKDVLKPMPIDMLGQIPYRFRVDSVQLHKSMISYFEYEVISKNPGIFFIDDFNVLAQNVTNDLTHIDSSMVLKFHGSGRLMKQANLDFTLVMPYFAPHRQWWFSAEAGEIDLTQFNLLTENVLGLTIRSGMGSLNVPLITGNDSVAKGTVNFLYRKLKLRLYNRAKSEKSKKFYSPFANFLMNSFMIHSNNPPFLGRTKKGIVWYERVPQKSFVNYIWKSNLSGILSTFGFNNKQQREGNREMKKETKKSNNKGSGK